WESMRTHPVSGARIVSHTQRVDRSAAVIVLEHHMAFDGAGYPERTPPKRQHVMSRIVAVADAYDAMTSRRSYSGARPPVDAMRRIVSRSGTAFDPVLVRLFVEMLGVYPPRSVVRLTDGRTAIVVRPGEAEPLRPVVRLVAESDGTLMEADALLDLAAAGAPAIARHLQPAGLNIDVDDYL
ncbi:MAG TPA: HD domain-containing phosphohydrolase, partial [Coriobacteriia bacterium]|nr:HD domain-containing phosphohydrolase [Coriobacteriia bacterium]